MGVRMMTSDIRLNLPSGTRTKMWAINPQPARPNQEKFRTILAMPEPTTAPSDMDRVPECLECTLVECLAERGVGVDGTRDVL